MMDLKGDTVLQVNGTIPTREFRERIKVSRGAKGNYTFEFTVETDPHHMKTTDELIEKVHEIQAKLEAIYPMEQVEK